MNVMATQLVPREVLERLVCSLAPDRVVLFGSRARSSARAASDIDLLLVGMWTTDRAQLLRRARCLVAYSFPRVDLVLCTPEEITAAEAGGAPFLRSILESGVLIYQR
jgi:predicted nucleotidyltransferase